MDKLPDRDRPIALVAQESIANVESIDSTGLRLMCNANAAEKPLSADSVRSEFLREFVARGFFYQCTDLEKLDAALSSGPVTAYVGVDLTAESIHVGNLVGIMALRLLQRTGHRPIVLLGGGTTKIGDPSGRDSSRQLLDEAGIERNRSRIAPIYERLLDFDADQNTPIMLDNDEWLSEQDYIPFLRDVGRHFSVNRMLSMESVKRRLDRDQSLSFLEFNYMILQAYDFVELSGRFGCTLQIGGSDQWGNIVNGVELGRRMHDRELFGLTHPLLTDAAGNKVGKSTGGATWLSAEMLEPYGYFQWWRNCDDADVGRFLRIFTDLPLGEIERLEALTGADINEAKRVLATEATRLAHGTEAAERAAVTARDAFERGTVGGDVPEVEMERAMLSDGVPFFAILRDAGLAPSGGEARRLAKGGGAYLNGESQSDPNYLVTLEDADDEGRIRLRAGKKRHAIVRAKSE